MYCPHCGEGVPEGAPECSSCGRRPFPEADRAAGSDWARSLGDSSLDTANALKGLLLDPMGALPRVYGDLGESRARAVGLVLCAFFALAASLGLTLGARRWLGSVAGFIGSGFEVFVKSFVVLLVVPLAFVVAGLGLRKVMKSSGGVTVDVFTAGMALAPMGLTVLVSGVLGIGNAEIVILLFLFAWTYLVLILYSGLTGVGELTTRAGAPGVPVLIVCALWLTKVVSALFF